jgi:hypothetical protein
MNGRGMQTIGAVQGPRAGGFIFVRALHPASILYFKVADIQAAHARIVQRKVTTESEPHVVARMPDLLLAEFRDSEGNIMAFMREVPR